MKTKWALARPEDIRIGAEVRVPYEGRWKLAIVKEVNETYALVRLKSKGWECPVLWEDVKRKELR